MNPAASYGDARGGGGGGGGGGRGLGQAFSGNRFSTGKSCGPEMQFRVLSITDTFCGFGDYEPVHLKQECLAQVLALVKQSEHLLDFLVAVFLSA